MTDDTERHLVTILAAIWHRVDWRVMQRNKQSKADAFSTRLWFASHEENLGAAVNTLCERLDVAAPASPGDTDEYVKAYGYCSEHENNVLDMLAERYKHLAVMTYKRAYDRVTPDTESGGSGEARP